MFAIPISRRNAVVSSLAVLAGLALAAAPARAQVVEPFKISGVGVGPMGLPLPGQPAREHWSIGEATHLGRYFGDGTVEIFTAVPDLAHGIIDGDFGSGSPYVFTGADGDQLVTWYGRTDHGASVPGTFVLTILAVRPDNSLLVQASFLAEFVAVPGASTGKFAGVTGSWTMYAWTAPFVLGSTDPVYYAWEGEGKLTFPHGK